MYTVQAIQTILQSGVKPSVAAFLIACVMYGNYVKSEARRAKFEERIANYNANLPFQPRDPATGLPYRYERQTEPGPIDTIATNRWFSIGLNVATVVIFCCLAVYCVGMMKFLIFGYAKCSWDKFMETDTGYRSESSAPYFEAETWPGWIFGGRLYRIYLLSDRVVAIEYGPAGLQNVLRKMQKGDAESVGMIHAGKEVHRILARMSFLDDLDEARLIELAAHDKKAFVAMRNEIRSIKLGPKPFRKCLLSCRGKLTLAAKSGTRVWTFMDDASLRNAKTILSGTDSRRPEPNLAKAFSDPSFSTARPSVPIHSDIVELVDASRRPNF